MSAYIRRALSSIAILTLTALSCAAGVVNTRSALLNVLGTGAVTEDFETFKFATNTAERVGATLDPTTALLGQGPGLIKDGLKFTESPYRVDLGLQWDRQFQYGLTSAAFVTDN